MGGSSRSSRSALANATQLVTAAELHEGHGQPLRVGVWVRCALSCDSCRAPSKPTPVLEGEDAEKLLRDLENTCTPEEAKRRIQSARKLFAKVMVPAVDDSVAAE